MANTGFVNIVGDRLRLSLDALAGTFAGSLSLVPGWLSNITITASGGAVTAIGMAIPLRYPFINGDTDQAELRIRLSRVIRPSETVTVTFTNLVGDGVTVNAPSTDLAMAQKNMAHTNVGQFCGPTTPVFYVDDVDGDDAAAALVSASAGYYTTADVGDDPENPSITPVAYASVDALYDTLRGTGSRTLAVTTNAVVLFKRGGTHPIARLATTGNNGVALTGGVSHAEPLVFGSYGDGAEMAVLTAGANMTSAGSLFVFSGALLYTVISQGLDLTGHSGTSITVATHPSAANSSEGLMLQGIKRRYMHLNTPRDDDESLRTGIGMVRVSATNPTGIGLSVAVPNSTNCFRDICSRRTMDSDIGANSLDHPDYFKTCEDWDEEDCYVLNSSGFSRKVDTAIGVHQIRQVCLNTAQASSSESNGNLIYGAQTSRLESSPGGVSKFVTIEDGFLADPVVGRAGVLGSAGYDVACTDDFELLNNFVLLLGGLTGSALELRRSGGADAQQYAKDGRRWRIEGNTFVGDVQYMLTLGIPYTDDFTLTGSKGWHDVIIRRNIFALLNNPSAGGSLIRMVTSRTGTVPLEYTTYAEARAAGRISATIEYNLFWSADSYVDAYTDGNINRSSIAAVEAAFGSDWSNNREEDPGFADPGYTALDYIQSLGYTDWDDFTVALENYVLTDTIPPELTRDGFIAGVASKYMPDDLSEPNYGGELPGSGTGEISIFAGLAVTAPGVGTVASNGTIALGSSVLLGAPTSVQLTLTNDGSVTNTIGTLVASGGITIDPADNPSGADIDPDATDTVTVLLDTASAGAKAGTLTIPSSKPGSPFVVNFTATVVTAADLAVAGPDGDLTSGDAISFGAANDIADLVTVQLDIRNDGGSALTLGTPSVTGDIAIDAGDNPDGATIAAGGTDTITLVLDTAAAGAKAGQLTIPSDAGSFVVNFSGSVLTAAALTVTVSDAVVASGENISAGGDIEQGTSAALTIDLTNDGGSDLDLGTIQFGPGLTPTSNPSGSTLAGGETAEIIVSLDTSSVAQRASSVLVPSTAAGSPWMGYVGWDVIDAPVVVIGPDGPDIEQSYLNVAEADAIIASYMPSTDPFRMVWDGTTDADKSALLNKATSDFDQVRLWSGRVAVIGQPGAWPRIDQFGNAALPGGEPTLPSGLDQTAWSFPGLPRDIRIGLAIQAAARAAQAAGVDSTLTTVEQGEAGIGSKSAGGQSVTINTATARAPSSILHPRARQQVKRYLAFTRRAF